MAETSHLQGAVAHIIVLLKQIAHQTRGNACCDSVPSSGVASIPAGLSSITVTQTGAGTVTITPTGGVAYTLNTVGETYTLTGGNLPAFTIASTDGGTWKWYGV